MPDRRSRRRRRRQRVQRWLRRAHRRPPTPRGTVTTTTPAQIDLAASNGPQTRAQSETPSARTKAALLADPTRRNTAIATELGVPLHRVAEVRYALTRDHLIHKYGHNRHHLPECWCRPDVASTADQVRAALLDRPDTPNSTIRRDLGVSLAVVARCREELLKQRLIHRFKFATGRVRHGTDCWCGGPPPPPPKPEKPRKPEKPVPPAPPPITRPWACVTWRGDGMTTTATYHHTRAEAEAAIPDDPDAVDSEIVDITTKPRRPRRSLEEILTDIRRPIGEHPYPQYRKGERK